MPQTMSLVDNATMKVMALGEENPKEDSRAARVARFKA